MSKNEMNGCNGVIETGRVAADFIASQAASTGASTGTTTGRRPGRRMDCPHIGNQGEVHRGGSQAIGRTARFSRRPLARAFQLGVSLIAWSACLFLIAGSTWGQSAQLEQSANESAEAETERRINFNRDIRPILSNTCFECHGPDTEGRVSDLRLDQKESVFDEMGVIVPHDAEASELYFRLTTDEEFSRMPPPDSDHSLTEEEIELFRLWIEQGAEWKEHWSFVPPERPDLPSVKATDWPRNEIDYFILAQNEEAGFTQNPPADRITLIRRLSLDLTGLPPTPDQVEAFLADDGPHAYERVVDRLLASPHYGEHQARYWLDAARYGDTHGLHLDNYREMWLYRDWVIDAFNANKPYDEFVVEQLAGDLLENPTDDQLIATGFNRAHVTTNEGGSIKEEVYVRNVVDRVETTGTVFMGLTIGCARCHDHKYDPFTQREFYELFAFFNSLDANPMDGNAKIHPPSLAQPTPEQEKAMQRLTEAIAEQQELTEQRLGEIEYTEPKEASVKPLKEPKEFVWVEDNLPEGAEPNAPWQWVTADKGPVYSGDRSSTRTATGVSQHYFTNANVPLRVGDGDQLFAYVYLNPENPPQQIMLQWNDGSWEHQAYWGESIIPFGKEDTPTRVHMGKLPATGQWVRLEVPAERVNLKAGSQIHGWAFTQAGGTVYWDKAGIVSQLRQGNEYRSFKRWVNDQRASPGASLPGGLKKLLEKDAAKLSDDETERLKAHFFQYVYPETREQFAALRDKIAKLQKEKSQLQAEIPKTMIYRETEEPRQAYFLNRGQYDQKGDPVERAVPDALPELPEDAPLNRLGLARWLVDPDHPLTARVYVNRLWQHVFGIGIVETAGDFGAQGTWPSHPELLDWLAVEFVESGWDVKKLMKRIVMSATYRQSAVATAEDLRRDPNNRQLARGPRFRLDAEAVRDQALAVSGLLVDKIGGPSVKPPQPDGLWFAVGYSGSNTVRFKKDEGHEKVHRRSLYTFWKRTAPPPQMSIMDAPSRESCVVRRERTNTPLQALMLMNDPQYVEAARYFAQLAIDEGETIGERLDLMFRRALARPPSQRERKLLRDNLKADRSEFAADPSRAVELVSIGEEPADLEKYDPVELATWTMAANLIMNTDEFITKP